MPVRWGPRSNDPEYCSGPQAGDTAALTWARAGARKGGGARLLGLHDPRDLAQCQGVSGGNRPGWGPRQAPGGAGNARPWVLSQATLLEQSLTHPLIQPLTQHWARQRPRPPRLPTVSCLSARLLS